MNRVEEYLATCPRPELASLLASSCRAALAAGQILLQLYEQPHQITRKGKIDLVTEADLAAEQAVIDLLQEAHPKVAVLAEESGKTAGGPNQPTWIIDPLDGTTNFAHGYPWFGTSIAYAEEGRSELGVIYQPLADELFWCCRGGGAWLNGRPITVSEAGKLTDGLLATGFPYDIHQHPEPVLQALAAVLTKVQGVRRAGAAALDLTAVACGRLDGFWEIKLKPWDTAAGMLLVQEAGGKVSDFSGGSYNPWMPELLASNGVLHEELTAILRDFSGLVE